MKTLTIRDVPDELHEALKKRALQNRRSMNQQVVAELGDVVVGETEQQRRFRVEKEIEWAEEARKSMTRFLTAEEIAAAIEAGRR